MEGQPQNPEFSINPENFQPCNKSINEDYMGLTKRKT